MKRCTLLLLVLSAMAFTAQAQSLGVKAGASAALLDGERLKLKTDYHLNYHVGVYYNYNLFGPISLRPELLYSLQGGEFKDEHQDFKTKLRYLNMPVLLDIKVGPVHLQGGPQFGVLLSAQETGTLLTGYSPTNQALYTNVSGQVTEQYKRTDFSLCGGVELEVTKNFSLGGRLNAGLNNIADFKDIRSANDPRLRNRVFQAYLAMRLSNK